MEEALQVFTAVKITGDHPNAGRAGSVRGPLVKIGEDLGDKIPAQEVQLDGEADPLLVPIANLEAL